MIFQNKKTPFQAIKTRGSKSRKIDIFSKGVNPWFWSKKRPFIQLFFLASIGQETVFYDILEGKNAFLAYKSKRFKKSKSCNFSKGVNPWFCSKNGHFPNFFFQAMQARKMSFMTFYNENTLFQAIKTRSSKTRKIDFFLKGLIHGFRRKLAIFPTFFFQAIQTSKMSFMIFQNEKTPFQGIKTRSSKSRKIDIFSKGLTHGFATKMAIFQTFFFRHYRPGKCVL